MAALNKNYDKIEEIHTPNQKTIDEIIPESGRFAGLRVESRK